MNFKSINLSNLIFEEDGDEWAGSYLLIKREKNLPHIGIVHWYQHILTLDSSEIFSKEEMQLIEEQTLLCWGAPLNITWEEYNRNQTDPSGT